MKRETQGNKDEEGDEKEIENAWDEIAVLSLYV